MASPLPPQLTLQDTLLVTGTALLAEVSPRLCQVNRGTGGEGEGLVLWGAPHCCHKPGRQANCSRGPASDGRCGRCVRGTLSCTRGDTRACAERECEPAQRKARVQASVCMLHVSVQGGRVEGTCQNRRYVCKGSCAETRS